MPVFDKDYDFGAAVVKVQNSDHPDGFVLMNAADVKDRADKRAEVAKRGGDPDEEAGPELVRYKPQKQPDQTKPPPAPPQNK